MNKNSNLGDLADIGLGFKSLQNEFFYLRPETVKTYGIEAKFLSPIFMIADFDTAKYVQLPNPRLYVFSCNEDEKNLKGSGALKYIRTMAGRAANAKKQSGTSESISEVLTKQGGKYWYAPKAARNPARIWLRKAMGGILSPLLSDVDIVVDQRCNFVIPKSGVSLDALSAILTSSLFAYSVEVNGSMSMGAGVLEAPTSKVRDYPVPDIRPWDATARKSLVDFAKAVWAKEKPVDWSGGQPPGAALRKLDEFVLSRMGDQVGVDELHRDIALTVASRYRLAASKTGTTKKKRSESVKSVAKEVAASVRQLLDVKPYPEGFLKIDTDNTQSFDVSGHTITSIESHAMLGQTDVIIQLSEKKEPLQVSLPTSAAEVLIRALLLGRSKFECPTKSDTANGVITESTIWLDRILLKITESVRQSSAGSGYEESVTAEVLTLLGMQQAAFEHVLPPKILFRIATP